MARSVSKKPARAVLLGPQRFVTTIGHHIRESGIAAPVATVTAGWQGRESELVELDHHVGVTTTALGLHERAEALMGTDTELLGALQERQDQLRSLQRHYRIRLDHALEAARELHDAARDAFVESELEAAIDAVRQLDARHVERKLDVQRSFDAKWKLEERETVVKQRAEVAQLLGRSNALVIAGGHVGVLRNRLWLFDVFGALGNKPIFAWSAGAMVLADRIVLFHDSPPQGAGNAEVHTQGFGICPGLVLLPHAEERLNLHDPDRVGLFARRFAPGACVTLEEGGAITWDGATYASTIENRILTERGTVETMSGKLPAPSSRAVLGS